MRGISVFAGLALFGIGATGVDAAVTISNDTTENMSCSGGVCAPTAADAVLNASDLESLLESGAATVTTTGSGVQADDIVVADGVTWTSNNALTLDAYQSIAVNSPVSVDGAAGLSLATNDGGTGGSLTFGNKGQLIFSSLSSALAINGTSYTLVGDIKTLASDIAVSPSGNFALGADYDARGDGTYSSSPIGTTFSGNFEGLGNAILNLSIKDSVPGYIGLFAELGGGRISDIGVINADIVASNDTNSSGYAVGALLGYANGAVSGSFSSGTETGVASNVGGLIGMVGRAGSVDHSRSSASVGILNGGAAIAADLVGRNDGTITNSYATGAVLDLGEGGVLAGLVGRNDGTIETSFASGQVYAGTNDDCGGLVGQNYRGGSVENSYATGGSDCNGTGSSAAGFAFENSATILQCYSTGAESAPSGAGFVVIRKRGGPMRKDYWDTTSSGTDIGVYEGSPAGIEGLTTEQLQSGLPKGFPPKIWAESPKINGGLPYLIANPPSK